MRGSGALRDQVWSLLFSICSKADWTTPDKENLSPTDYHFFLPGIEKVFKIQGPTVGQNLSEELC